MRTTFTGIEIARRAVQAQQRSLNVVGHNVANANTPGYSRQVAVHTASRPYAVPQIGYSMTNGQVGTGVQVSQVTRMQDEFVEMRLRQENHSLGYWQSMEEGLEQIELVFNEPSENSIHHALDMFWDSMQEVSKHPENTAPRAVALQRAEVLTETIRHTHGQLKQLRDNMNDLVGIKVGEVNSLASRIATLNDQIGKASATGNNPNDLLDQRDNLLQELSVLTSVQVIEDTNRMVRVSLGGVTLVQRDQSYTLETESTANHGDIPPYAKVNVVWEGVGTPVRLSGGELGGVINLRETEIQGFLNELNQWTADLMNAVNDIHRHDQTDPSYDLEGNQGRDFFTLNRPAGSPPTVTPRDDPAGFIRVNLSRPEEIAASSLQGMEGNGEIALKLANLRYEEPSGSAAGDGVLSDRYNAMISGLGVKSQKARVMLENEEILVKHLKNLKEATSGVSLDEEMADMIRYQHAYTAAARVMTVMDEALDVIINRLGLVGR